MNALIIAAHDGRQLDPATAAAVGAAGPLAAGPLAAGGRIDVLVVGDDAAATAGIAAQAATLAGVGAVLTAAAPALAAINAETLARQIVAITGAGAYAWVLAPHNLLARAALPRAAALAGGAYLADVIRTAAAGLERPAYAGAVISRVQPLAAITFLTVRASAFPAAAAAAAEAAPVSAVATVEADRRSRLLGSEGGVSTRPDLSRARIVVAGGRGIGSAENMARVEALADHLGAAVGASRAAVDAGFAPNSLQIGQTGKVVAPDLYLALGISGAIQHLAGIKDAKCIVAINKDPDAPIFQIADYGIVGDLFEALPVLQAQLPAASA